MDLSYWIALQADSTFKDWVCKQMMTCLSGSKSIDHRKWQIVFSPTV
jgi:hypothetical protein